MTGQQVAATAFVTQSGKSYAGVHTPTTPGDTRTARHDRRGQSPRLFFPICGGDFSRNAAVRRQVNKVTSKLVDMAMIRVSDELHRAAKVRAAREGVALGSVVDRALAVYARGDRLAEAVRDEVITPEEASDGGLCAACDHALVQHKAGKGTATRFCQVAGSAVEAVRPAGEIENVLADGPVVATVKVMRVPTRRGTITSVAGACATCGHALSQHKAASGTTSRFCQVAGCSCRVRG